MDKCDIIKYMNRKPKNTFEFEHMKEEQERDGRKHLFTIQFGALTAWIRDISLIVLIWKIIGILPHFSH